MANINVCNRIEVAQLGLVPVLVEGPVDRVRTYALMNSGSDSTLIKKSVLDRVGLRGEPTNLRIRTVTGETDMMSYKCNLVVHSLDGENSVTICDAFSVSKLPTELRAESPTSIAKEWPHLSDIQFEDIGNGEVGLLIGCDTPEAHWVLDQRIGGNKQPFAVRTTLGWMVLGPRKCKDGLLTINNTITEEVDVYDFLKRMYNKEFEDLGVCGRYRTASDEQKQQIRQRVIF